MNHSLEHRERTARSLRLRAARLNPISEHLRHEWSDNNENPFEEYSANSQKKVLWICRDCKNEWLAVIATRTNGHGCPVCSISKRRATTKRTKPLLPATLVSEIMSDYSTLNLTDNADWMCSVCSYEWTTQIRERLRGTGCPNCFGIRRGGARSNAAILSNPLSDGLAAELVVFEKLAAGSDKKVDWKCGAGHIWTTEVRARTNGHGCPKCATNGPSKAEVELGDYIESLGIKVVRNSRSVISPKEIDIYLPEKNIAVEFNGLYWHSEDRVGKNYHYDKWSDCYRSGIQLIQIWEDDYRFNTDVVKSMLRAKILGRKPVGARKTTAQSISVSESNDFLKRHHIQAGASGSYHIGLFLDEGLVAVSVWKRSGTDMRLERYASSVSVVGGLSKMMKMVPGSRFITFADHCVSNGALYETTGWKKDSELAPDYSYIVGGRREHKFNFRRKRFLNDPHLEYVGSMSERQMAELNGLPRIYDAGKTKYVFER